MFSTDTETSSEEGLGKIVTAIIRDGFLGLGHLFAFGSNSITVPFESNKLNQSNVPIPCSPSNRMYTSCFL